MQELLNNVDSGPSTFQDLRQTLKETETRMDEHHAQAERILATRNRLVDGVSELDARVAAIVRELDTLE